jgi:hypothetical protein
MIVPLKHAPIFEAQGTKRTTISGPYMTYIHRDAAKCQPGAWDVHLQCDAASNTIKDTANGIVL